MRNLLLLFLVFSFLHCKPPESHDKPSPLPVNETVLTEHLAYPWEILWGPDNFIWMTERGGTISRVNPSNGTTTLLHTIAEVQSNGEGGLLGMALHPDFSSHPYVYVAYNYKGNKGYKEKIVRFTYKNNTLLSPVVLLDHINASGIHNGCRLLIWNNKLFITTGDASNGPDAQDMSSLNGKLLRLNLDGTIPADNPIANNPVWTFGHRNAQGLTLVGNKLFVSEHGPSTDDEINIIEKGRNYGWPDVAGTCDNGSEESFCADNQVKEPIKTWTPTAAVCGMAFYDRNLIPSWKNSLLVTALKNSRLYVLKLNKDQTAITSTEEFYNGRYGRLRDVCVSPSGKVYICTSNGDNDKIIEISR
jgi:glucose/arabinose dehydrogenase